MMDMGGDFNRAELTADLHGCARIRKICLNGDPGALGSRYRGRDVDIARANAEESLHVVKYKVI
jgi:hypothetical protein